MRPALAALLLSPLLAGCLQHLPADLPSIPLGSTSDVPVGPATGRAHSVHFFGWRRFGDDTTDAAIADAKKAAPEDDLINVAVNRKILCFPACDWALVIWAETQVDGTLVRYRRLPEWKRPSTPAPAPLPVGERPPAEPLLARLMHLYEKSPAEAAEFFASLDNASRKEVIDEVVSSKGKTSTTGWTFHIPSAAPPEEKKFLAWFVGRYTTYQPLDE